MSLPVRAVLASGLLALTLAGCTGSSTDPAPPPNGGETPATTGDNGATTAAPALPSYWFAADVEQWPGKSWKDIDLFQFIDSAGLDDPVRYVVFYSRTCEHCEEMFNTDFVTNPTLAGQVIAVEIPTSKEQLTSDDGWPMPTTKADLRSLPVGCDWILTPPLAVKIENGVVTCANEGDHKACLGG